MMQPDFNVFCFGLFWLVLFFGGEKAGGGGGGGMSSYPPNVGAQDFVS